MFKSKQSSASFWEGVLIGGAVAAMTTFMLGTENGKKLQKNLFQQYKKMGVKAKHLQDYLGHAKDRLMKAKLPKAVKKLIKKSTRKASNKKTAKRRK